MRHIIHKIKIWSLSFFALFTTTYLLQGCKDDEAMKWVDLRYRVEQDAYTVDAKGTEQVSFQVKSTDPWEVFGTNHEDWYTISPDKGKASDETTTVTISCKENTALDDRTDIINIKSDYWTGKQFTLTQKGIAYLNIEGVEMINQEGDAETFDVLSNQKWTAKVTTGEIWLSIKSGTSGELDGQITIEATPNTGEQRTGIITIYDRRGEIAQEVQCKQDGVLLTPTTPENGKWFAIYEQAQKLTIHVESNAEWTVYKENETDDNWYDFEKTSFDGSEDLVINVSEHQGSSVRTGVIVLATKASEGATPLTKTVKFKQANPKKPVVTEINTAISGDKYGPGNLVAGRYNFYIEPFDGPNLNLFFIWGSTEIRFWIIDKKTQLSTTPYSNAVNIYQGNLIRAVDTSKPNVISFEIQESIDTKDPAKSWMYNEWILNDEIIVSDISDGLTPDGNTDNWKVPFSDIKPGGNFLFRASGGSIRFTKWEYVAPLVWGD